MSHDAIQYTLPPTMLQPSPRNSKEDGRPDFLHGLKEGPFEGIWLGKPASGSSGQTAVDIHNLCGYVTEREVGDDVFLSNTTGCGLL